eukprot:CAMPEP_0116090636 /NCGR_PEP_ID=MMETSP0327-20121206/7077_1 /TAXON_ID=44447 /ORGANISM="Pseudo-nitzschia delicatissima, Strain B596" /LENGTH=1228 /DNA_ID=CAMNT_0003581933 /DNA_START=252 /DNA_END=3938 /DNA_ORIENTATION=+
MYSNKSKSNNKGQNSSSSREMAGGAVTGSTTTATNTGKKRKVWARPGDSASNSASSASEITSNDSAGRTVKITNPSGGNRTVNITTTTHTSNSGKNNARIPSAEKRSADRGGTEVKISFGPSRPPTMSSSSNGRGKNKNNINSNHNQQNSYYPSSSAAAAASMAAMMGGGNGFGDLDLEALKEKAAAAAAGQKTFRNKHGLPCTEAEMKALMSMFVEIMGMSMNSKGGGTGNASGAGAFGTGNMMYSDDDSDYDSSPRNSGGPVFSFGANPMDASSLAAMAAAASGSPSGMIPDHMAAATAGFFADGASWEALKRTYAAAEQMAAVEDDDDDDESFENRELTFEELEFLLHHRKQKEEAAKLASQFASGDWESLEQVAINDHLLSETDDKERKAAKKREKKQRRKAKLKEEAAQKAAEAAQKKREKAVVSWRSRVVSACQSNEIMKLDGLLQDSPLRKLMEEDNNINKTDGTDCIIPHLEFLLPNSVAKNRAQVERGIDARLRLAEYILENELSLAFKPLRTGRTALHTACFHGDVRFLQLLFDKIETYEPTEGQNSLPEPVLNLTCDESGWSPLHYASLSGSSEIMELLLAKGCDLSTRTDVTHTWRESDGKGLTPRELVQIVQSGNYEEVIETHGLALQEMTNAFFNHQQERKVFVKKLERVQQRLSSIEKNGYTPLSNDKTENPIDSDPQTEVATKSKPEGKKKKKKKKKKQSGKEAESGTASNTGANQNTAASARSNSILSKEEKDPLVAALIGMGFNEEQIMAAVKACGGTHRATADDLVTWILGQGENEEVFTEPQNNSGTKEESKQPRDQSNQSKQESVGSNEYELRQQQVEEARQKEEAARRLAAKREETRRRNREWNNREQARQQKEGKAKVAQKLYSAPAIPVTRNAISGIKPPGRHAQTGNKWGVPPPVKTQSQWNVGQSNVAPHGVSSAATKLATGTEQHVVPISRIYTTNDDDKTVSSFGSSRGMSVSSKELVPLASHPSVAPPGFSPSATQPIAESTSLPVSTLPEIPSAASLTEKPRQGEIRATAKEFVPSFSLPDGGNSDEIQQKERIPSNNRPASQSAQSYDIVGLPPGILPQQGVSTVGGNSLLGFENSPSMTPPSAEPILPGTSFIGMTHTEEPAMTIPFSFGTDDYNESNDIGGSRLLSSISRNTAVGITPIWGETQNIPSLENTLHPSFFGDGNDNGASDEKNTSSWQMPSGGNSLLPNGGGQGSIW